MASNEWVPTLDISNVSFIVNTKKCGKGKLRCVATYPDGNEAPIDVTRLAKNIFRLKIKPDRTGPLHLYIDFLSQTNSSAATTAAGSN